MPPLWSPSKFLIECLSRHGVRHIFGIPGRAIIPLYNAIYDEGYPEAILASHETGAAFMAIASAQLSGTLGVCCGTTGPGATNLLTGVATAFTEGIPLLVITGQTPLSSFGTRAYQESSGIGRTVDTVALFRLVTKHSALVVSPAHFIRTLSSWLPVALADRPGPIHLSVPWDIWDQEINEQSVAWDIECATRKPLPRAPTHEDLLRVIEILSTACSPSLLLGRGVATSRAGEAALECATHWGARVFTTTRAKGVVPTSHPNVVGHIGPAASSLAAHSFKAEPPDVLLAVGTSLGPMALGSLAGQVQKPPIIIQVNVDPSDPGIVWKPTYTICSDALTFFSALAKVGLPTKPRPLTSVVLSQPSSIDSGSASFSDGLHPLDVFEALRRCLPSDAIVLPDSGSHWLWAVHTLDIHSPNSFFAGRCLGAMGQATAGVVGAKLACPERPVIAITGDGSFLMHGSEMAVAARLNLPVIWIVINNRSHHRIYSAQQLDFGGRVISTTLQDINFTKIAEAFGGYGMKVQSIAELEDSLNRASSLTSPTLIEIPVTRDVSPPL